MIKNYRRTAKSQKNKLLSMIVFVIVLLVASIALPAFANVLPRPNIATTAFMSLRHNPTGINQEVLVNSWTTPNAPRWADLNMTPPTDPANPLMIPAQSNTSGIPRLGYTYTITKPDGTVNTVVRTSDGPSTDWFIFRPDQLGTWTVEFSWAGVEFKDSSGNVIASFLGCTTGKQQLIVQQEQIPYAPAAPLPTDKWNYPIISENREWYAISGPYLEPTTGTARGYDGTGSRFNPYSRGPNTAHIAWMDPPASGMAGLVGGQYGQIPQYGATAGTINVVMAGRAYYTANNLIYCLDIRTGQRLWTAPGTYTFGTIEGSAPPATGSGTGLYNGMPTLVFVGDRLIKYDGLTGAVKLNMSAIVGGTVSYLGNDYSNAYMHQRPANVAQFSPTGHYLTKLNFLGTGTNLTARIVYNVSYPFMAQDVGICIYGDILTNIHYPEYGQSGGINTTTGAVLWSRYIDGIEQKVEAVTSANGVMYCSANDRHFMAIDMKTGNQLWLSEQAAYPWGNFWAYGEAAAYNMAYGLSYAGVYAFDTATGKINWHFASPDSGMETPYNTVPFGSIDPIVADGKVYAPTSEHSPTLYYRGQHLYCLDAQTGTLIWNIMGYYTPQAIAEDRLFATNAYDGNKYCFGRGDTVTTVSTDLSRVAKGESAWITGTIMDMSPAQPNTPCVGKDSMTAWMEYLHLQQACPTNITGVPVTLTALKSDGTSVDIGTATSNAYGTYSLKWTPPSEDAYTVIAKFAGDDSYYSSSATTVMTVGAAAATPQPTSTPTATVSPTPSITTPPSGGIGTEIYVGIAAIVIIAIVAAVALLLRRRK
jgi:outer membrane protein assembly factor BamB